MKSANHQQLLIEETENRQALHWGQEQVNRRPPSHPAVQALFEPRAQFVARLVGRDRKTRVLDVGCGNGFLTVPLERHFDEVVAMDFSESMLAINPCRCKLRGDATEIAFPDGAFEVVVASHLLHHLSAGQQEQAVREMCRVARRVVVIYEPNRNHPLMAAFGMARAHERLLLAFAPSRPRLLLQAAGLPRVVSRIEGLITPNLCPAFLAPAARALGGTGLRRLGFYVRAVGWHAESGLDLSALDA